VPLVIVHGNNGSVDGDSPAAMRYTEARLAKIAEELVIDIDKNTVRMAPNFDDTVFEPTVMPAKYPNLLVNGATGISSGYATNMPPHNLGETIDAALLYLKNPHINITEIMKVMPGPDFPTGGIIQGKEGIKTAFTTGRGKIILKSKIKIVKEKGSESFIITELPYEVNKATLIRKIDEMIYSKKIEGIDEIRDESDLEGLRIAIDLKKNANAEAILNYLLKNSDLQINYNFNMVAIKDRRPQQMSVIQLLEAFINHRLEVITNRSQFDLDRNEKRLHVADGIKKAISILDEIIKVIRKSVSKGDAKNNIINAFDFDEVQAEAIVMMQLYKLSNTDITKLLETITEYEKVIANLKYILASDANKRDCIEQELNEIKINYPIARRSKIEAKVSNIEINKEDLIRDEEIYLTISKLGYIKRSPIRSFNSSDNVIKFQNEDYFLLNMITSIKKQILILFNDGTYVYLPVYDLKESK